MAGLAWVGPDRFSMERPEPTTSSGRERRRADMDLGGISWGLQTIVGAALFIIVVLWVVLRSRRTTPEEERQSDAATRKVYEEEEAAHGHESDDMP